MAEIKPHYVPIDYNQITLSSEELLNEREIIEASDERVYAQILTMTGQYDAFSIGYQGDSSTTYVQAMNTLFGKAEKLSCIQKNCARTLFNLSLNSVKINESAYIQAFYGGVEE